MQFRVVPIRVFDSSFGVVHLQRLGHTAPSPKGILPTRQPTLGVLLVKRLAVALAGKTQHDSQHMAMAAFAVCADDRSAFAKIGLRFRARLAFDAAERQRLTSPHPMDQPPHRMVGALEALFLQQVLKNALGR